MAVPGEQRLAPRDRFSPLEFLIVIGAAFGQAIYGSIRDVLDGTTLGPRSDDTFGAADTHYLIAEEAILLVVLGAVLFVGGWRPKDVRLGIGVRSTIIGVALFAALYLMDILSVYGLIKMFPFLYPYVDAWWSYRPAEPAGVAAVILLAVINPLFEELFACAFVIKSLRRRFGLTAAIWVSATLRMLYHLYQGLTAAPLHFAQGLIHGFLYVRLGILWPLIFAHFLSNLLGGLLYLW